MGIKTEGIRSLGVPKSYKCTYCGKRNYRTIEERRNLANCMIYNCKGLWALEHCGHCGYVAITYPKSINGIQCTVEECKRLFEEMKRYDEVQDR